MARPPVTAPESHDTEIATLSKHGYLFGHKLAASLSPFLHNTIYASLDPPLNWAQLRLESANVLHFLQLASHPGFYGASVTMPNKVAILRHLDHLTDECAEVGACNTVFVRENEDGKRVLWGANTDVVGVREAFFQNVTDRTIWEGRPGMVVGGGGAARSAVYALRKWFGVMEIYLVNRDNAEVQAVIDECVAKGYGEGLVHVRNVEQGQGLEAPGAVVACVPDFPPVTEAEVRARRVLEVFLKKNRKGVLLEMCYNPTPFTEIGAIAENAGWQVILGTEAMIWQGLEQDRYWTGKTTSELPVAIVKDAVAAKLAQIQSAS